MKAWALIYATFRQSMHRRLFWVLLAMSAVSTLFCLGMGFHDRQKLTLSFGMISIPWASLADGMDTPEGFVKYFLSHWLVSGLAGTLGIALALITTAGFIPEFVEEGAIQVILAKPMSRWTIFLAKVAGAVLFIAFHAVVFVGGTLLAVGIRSGIWLPGYFAAAGLLTLVFMYLYPVSVWLGMRFRSTLVAVLGTLLFWLVCGSIQAAKSTLEFYQATVKVGRVDQSPFAPLAGPAGSADAAAPDRTDRPSLSPTARRIIQMLTVMDAVVPKTGDLGLIAQDLLGWKKPLADVVPRRPGVSPESARREFEKIEEFSYLESLGSSLAFAAAVLFLAGRTFVKQDY